MGAFAFCEILCSFLRQSHFMLVHEIYQSSRRSFYYRIYKDHFKHQVPGVKLTLASKWSIDGLLICSCQNSNIITMPKRQFEGSSEPKHKEKKLTNKLHFKSSSLKLIKKKKKKKNHHHTAKHSKQHSPKTKTLIAQNIDLILLDSSYENDSDDSDVCILYDSHDKGKIFDPCHTSVHDKNDENNETGTCSKSGINENTVRIYEESEQNEVNKETNEHLILHEVSEQCSSLRQISQNEEEQGLLSTCASIPLGGGISSVLKSDREVSGQSSGKLEEKKTKKHKIKRKWELTHFGQTMPNEITDSTSDERSYLMFNVLSYNVLCQEIMEEHMDLYRLNDPRFLDWNFRSKLLMEEFVDFNADVMCLQEVQESQLKSFYSELQKIGYTGLFKQRTGGKKDGVAIYFRNSTFQLIDYTTVEYYQPGISVLNRDNVGLIVKLAPIMKPDERIIVATTHLLYNPRRHDVKLAQVQLLLAEVERFAFKGIDESRKMTKYWPVILTGDLNFEPNTGGFHLLNMGWFRYDGLCSRTLTTEYYGMGRILGKELIPPYLGVTDSCQHMSLVARRSLQFRPDTADKPKDDHKTEIKLLQIYNSDFKKHASSSESTEVQELHQVYVASPKKFSSGQLRHPLHLSSVYNHELQDHSNGSQVSTFQNEWVVVDYIFYSNVCNPSPASERENLKLVARYKLLSAEEATRAGPIPNDKSPSDHYPLAAKFALLF